jgi:hypothetical protein
LFLPLFAILQRKVTGSWMKVTKLAWAWGWAWVAWRRGCVVHDEDNNQLVLEGADGGQQPNSDGGSCGLPRWA